MLMKKNVLLLTREERKLLYIRKNIIEEKTNYRTTKFSYDKNDQLILEEEYDDEGNLSKAKKCELSYIEGTSNLKNEIIFKKRGTEDFQKYAENSYSYEDEKLKKEIQTSSFYQYVYHYEYYLNEKVKEKITLNGETEKTITKYHENANRKVEDVFRSEGPIFPMELDQTNKWTYDEYDNEIMVEIFRNEKLT